MRKLNIQLLKLKLTSANIGSSLREIFVILMLLLSIIKIEPKFAILDCEWVWPFSLNCDIIQ